MAIGEENGSAECRDRILVPTIPSADIEMVVLNIGANDVTSGPSRVADISTSDPSIGSDKATTVPNFLADDAASHQNNVAEQVTPGSNIAAVDIPSALNVAADEKPLAPNDTSSATSPDTRMDVHNTEDDPEHQRAAYGTAIIVASSLPDVVHTTTTIATSDTDINIDATIPPKNIDTELTSVDTQQSLGLISPSLLVPPALPDNISHSHCQSPHLASPGQSESASRSPTPGQLGKCSLTDNTANGRKQKKHCQV
ncbi:hypothetical protein CVT25_010505 [Psilocybe cyanescens]|uniref:Uncharacterized protein n=1 Tax=Psilocybe cyanescens TaxID=93625 RepID=A0A409XGS3_PSICY|nr:hypothetical protein CVT25_010505 [Psilocybe cyanescens]